MIPFANYSWSCTGDTTSTTTIGDSCSKYEVVKWDLTKTLSVTNEAIEDLWTTHAATLDTAVKAATAVSRSMYNYFCNVDVTNSTTTATDWFDYGKCQKYRFTTGTAFTYSWNCSSWDDFVPKTPQERLREIIKSRVSPGLLLPRPKLLLPKTVQEQRARETLLRLIGDTKYQRFLSKGFITARGKSGLTYQIFPDHGITRVYDQGHMVEKLCVVMVGQFPPTDSLIMRYILILDNEDEFRKMANITPSLTKNPIPLILTAADPVPTRSLVDIYRELAKKNVGAAAV